MRPTQEVAGMGVASMSGEPLGFGGRGWALGKRGSTGQGLAFLSLGFTHHLGGDTCPAGGRAALWRPHSEPALSRAICLLPNHPSNVPYSRPSHVCLHLDPPLCPGSSPPGVFPDHHLHPVENKPSLCLSHKTRVPMGYNMAPSLQPACTPNLVHPAPGSPAQSSLCCFPYTLFALCSSPQPSSLHVSIPLSNPIAPPA